MCMCMGPCDGLGAVLLHAERSLNISLDLLRPWILLIPFSYADKIIVDPLTIIKLSIMSWQNSVV